MQEVREAEVEALRKRVRELEDQVERLKSTWILKATEYVKKDINKPKNVIYHDHPATYPPVKN